MLPDHQFITGKTNRFGIHNFVRHRIFQNAVLVNAGLMGKGVGPDNGLIRLDDNAGNHRHESAGRIDFPGIDGRLEMHQVHPGIQGHHHLFKGSIARPLPDTVDGDFRLPRPCPYARKSICGGQTQIVVAVNAQDRFMDVGCVGPHIRNQLKELFGNRVSHCIRQIYGRSPCLNDGLKDLAQKIPVASGSVFCRKFNVIRKGPGIFYCLHRFPDDLVAGHLQFVFQVDVGCGDKGVDSRFCRFPDCSPGLIDIALCSPGKGGNLHISNFFGNHLDGFKITWRGCRKPGFHHIHPQFFQLYGQTHLFRAVHAGAGRLLAIPEGRIKNNHSIFHKRISL